MNIIKLFSSILALLFCAFSYAQEEGSFAVVTFERIVHHRNLQTFYWITNRDSSELRLYPFFLEEDLFSPEKIQLQDTAKYWYMPPVEERYNSFLAVIIKTIKDNRIKVQSIKIKTYTSPEVMEYNFDETINIYLSFFKGTVLKFPFYSEFRYNRKGTLREFEGIGYIPFYDFSLEKDVNASFKARLFRQNYALFPYDYYMPDCFRTKPTDLRNFQIKMNRDAKRTVPIWNIYE